MSNDNITYIQTKYKNWYIEELRTQEETEYLKHILEHMIEKYILVFGEDIILKEDCYIHIDSNSECPMLITNQKLLKIRLVMESSSYWAQLIYQLSHEICHYAIRQDEGNKTIIKWFEETVCEAMSLYILDYFSETWSQCELSKINKNYSDSIRKYFKDIVNVHKESKLLKYINLVELINIENTCENDRLARSQERNYLYRIFKDNPNKIYMVTKYRRYKISSVMIDFDLWLEDENYDDFIMLLKDVHPKF